MALPPEESEFDRLSVTREYADNARIPMVKESPVKFECRYLGTHRLKGNSPVGSIDIVFAQVETIHIDDLVITADGKLDITLVREGGSEEEETEEYNILLLNSDSLIYANPEDTLRYSREARLDQ